MAADKTSIWTITEKQPIQASSVIWIVALAVDPLIAAAPQIAGLTEVPI
jgi:hypothetical protein